MHPLRFQPTVLIDRRVWGVDPWVQTRRVCVVSATNPVLEAVAAKSPNDWLRLMGRWELPPAEQFTRHLALEATQEHQHQQQQQQQQCPPTA
ncbi:hypothetical protein FI667_g6999, partial [Globisporangium splendens]